MKKEDLYNLPKYAGIYLLRNTVNGKCYVGQSIKLRSRLLHHINNLEHCRYDAPIYRALSKYGLEAFELKILKSWHNALDKRTKYHMDTYEKQYIEEYNSLVPNGYNQTIGGDGGIEGYKFTEEQVKKLSDNGKKAQNDGRNTVYCYVIETGKVIKSTSLPILNSTLNESIRTSDIRNFIIKGKYIIDRDKEKFQKKIASFKKGGVLNSKFSTKLTPEMIEDIKAGMTQKAFCMKYNVCKKSFYNYKNSINENK